MEDTLEVAEEEVTEEVTEEDITEEERAITLQDEVRMGNMNMKNPQAPLTKYMSQETI